MTVAIILGGGAPNLTLMSGALAALEERKARFSAIAASGAGMLVALLYAAPKGMTPAEALKSTKNMGVSDEIYRWFSINFKVFHKPGLLADQFRKTIDPYLGLLPQDSPTAQFVHDWFRLVAATFTPSDLSPTSQGLCAAAPWIEDAVDFDKLKAAPYDFYLNAFNLAERKMRTFEKNEITASHFRAALAFPFLYSPFMLDGDPYIEGSAVDTFNFEALLKDRQIYKRGPIKTLVVFDVLGFDKILHAPNSLYDAWVQSIMVPLVSMAKDDLKIFEREHERKYPIKLEKIKFDEGQIVWPEVLDWSRSNLSRLYDVGYKAGADFYDQHRKLFSDHSA